MQPTKVPRSRVIHLGYDSSRCGYCRNNAGSQNYAFWALRLHVSDYQELLDAGWRRSGNYLYRPNLKRTCCPPFVIRLHTNQFKPSSTHKRVLKRLRRMSNHSASDKTTPLSSPPKQSKLIQKDHRQQSVRDAVLEAARTLAHANHANLQLSTEHIRSSLHKIKVFPYRRESANQNKQSNPSNLALPMVDLSSIVDWHKRNKHLSPNLVSNVALAIAEMERRNTKPQSEQVSDSASQSQPRERLALKLQTKAERLNRQLTIAKSLQMLLSQNQSLNNIAEVRVTHPGFLNFWWIAPKTTNLDDNDKIENTKEVELQNSINDSAMLENQSLRNDHRKRPIKPQAILAKSLDVSDVSELDVMSDWEKTSTQQSSYFPSPSIRTTTSEGHSSIDDEHPWRELYDGQSFSMCLVPAEFRSESYDVFRKYQMTIHRENPSQCTKEVYTRFLVDSPLISQQSSSNPDERYGSFHVLYRLSGKLFAVGVVDVLPRCLSSVYLFYDPDFAKLSPGTLSALKEIEWIKSVSHVYPSMKYYYMGYYIHSCPKMRYKAGFYPSELLCEVTKNWVAVEDAKKVLDRGGERNLRLAPIHLSPSVIAAQFGFNEKELCSLADEAILHLGAADDEVMRMVSFRDLKETVNFRYRGQVDSIRDSIVAFLHHVGKVSSKYYIHMM